ncbi:DUF4054 domain-containing protein [Sphingobium sp. H39-3-25]|uniref:DUF4054 domain-containing protein n=1 Tax=Sphingobium arseniciresistens TaxID=3030834 RepID=UPI0023BA3CB4|nr:DUF4054 domain-containing protein [Sphingobium arseniciresistens]
MAYTRITLSQFTDLFPAFLALTQGQYDAWAPKAEARVGTGYGDAQQDATELLLAHLLSINGIGQSSQLAGIAAAGVTDFKSGGFSASISADAVKARVAGGYGASPYGQQFEAIQRRIFSGPRLIGGGYCA